MKIADIIAVRTHDGNIVCSECITDELKSAKEADIMIQENLDNGEDIFWCSKCKEQI